MQAEKFLLSASLLTMVLLGGCTHEVALREPEGRPIGKAEISFESNKAGTLKLNTGDAIYSGNWTAEKVSEHSTIAKKYGINSRRYKQYSLGDGNYLWQGKATLQSVTGNELECEFSYRGVFGRGFCSSESGRFEFVGEG